MPESNKQKNLFGKPIEELKGDWLAKQGKLEEALHEYRKIGSGGKAESVAGEIERKRQQEEETRKRKLIEIAEALVRKGDLEQAEVQFKEAGTDPVASFKRIALRGADTDIPNAFMILSHIGKDIARAEIEKVGDLMLGGGGCHYTAVAFDAYRLAENTDKMLGAADALIQRFQMNQSSVKEAHERYQLISRMGGQDVADERMTAIGDRCYREKYLDRALEAYGLVSDGSNVKGRIMKTSVRKMLNGITIHQVVAVGSLTALMALSPVLYHTFQEARLKNAQEQSQQLNEKGAKGTKPAKKAKAEGISPEKANAVPADAKERRPGGAPIVKGSLLDIKMRMNDKDREKALEEAVKAVLSKPKESLIEEEKRQLSTNIYNMRMYELRKLLTEEQFTALRNAIGNREAKKPMGPLQVGAMVIITVVSVFALLIFLTG